MNDNINNKEIEAMQAIDIIGDLYKLINQVNINQLNVSNEIKILFNDVNDAIIKYDILSNDQNISSTALLGNNNDIYIKARQVVDEFYSIIPTAKSDIENVSNFISSCENIKTDTKIEKKISKKKYRCKYSINENGKKCGKVSINQYCKAHRHTKM